jgi:hypothetical protein
MHRRSYSTLRIGLSADYTCCLWRSATEIPYGAPCQEGLRYCTSQTEKCGPGLSRVLWYILDDFRVIVRNIILSRRLVYFGYDLPDGAKYKIAQETPKS